MSNARKSEYLEAKVTTASPAQLHLMLIEGALRFGREAEKAFLRDDESAATPLALRVLDIVEEMIAGVRHREDELNQKLTRLYEYVYSQVASAYVNTDHQKMGEALRVLEFERDTWRQACSKIAGSRASEGDAHTGPTAPHLGASLPSERLTLEA